MMRCIYRGKYYVYTEPHPRFTGMLRTKIHNPRTTLEIEFLTGKSNIKPLLNYIKKGGEIERLETRV